MDILPDRSLARLSLLGRSPARPATGCGGRGAVRPARLRAEGRAAQRRAALPRGACGRGDARARKGESSASLPFHTTRARPHHTCDHHTTCDFPSIPLARDHTTRATATHET